MSEAGGGESCMMAEKRRSEAVGPVAYSKLPRLEADPDHVHAAGLCRSGVLPGQASDGHYSFQGTYFGYPLPCHQSPELSVHWSPAEPYVSCTDGGVIQQLRPEKTRCMLYSQESGFLETWAPNPSYEKRKDCLGGDTLAAPEKWAHYSGHTDFIQQSWVQGFPMLHPAQVPTGCAPLLAPKPVYRNHVYCPDAGCGPKGSLAPGRPGENPLKRPTDVEWTPPSSGHLGNASCGSAAAKKAQVAESGFLPSPQSWKDSAAAQAGFSPYHKMFENLQVAPSALSVDTSYPAGCKSRKSVPEECARSPCGKVWSKLPPPASPLAAPQGLIYRERTSACYPLPSYSLTSHEQLVLYNRSITQVEKQKAPFASTACQSFNFPAGEAPQPLPTTCFPPAPRSYYPSYLENDFYRALGSPLTTSPGPKAFKEHGSQQNSQPKVSFEQRGPISTCSVAEKASRGSSLHSREGARDWPGAEGTAKPADESLWCQQAIPQPRSFHPLQSVERSPSCTDGYRRAQEAFYGAGPCPLGKGPSREAGPSCAEKQSSLNSEDKRRDSGELLQSGACIEIPDSPVASHDPCLKDSLRSRVSQSSDSRVQHVLQSPDKEPRGLELTEAPLSPPSPPMPVIHNVFSLAPYQEYLEGSAVSLRPPSSEGRPVEKPSPEKSWQKAEGTASPRPPSAGSSKTPGALPVQGKDATCNAVAEGGRKDPRGSCIVLEKESRGLAGFCENYRRCQDALASSRQGATGCASEFAKEEHALDLSLKTEGLLDVLHAQRLAGKTEALERENGKRDRGNMQEVPAKGQGAIQDANSPALQLPQKSCSEEKSSFQSSAAFLYKKFKILKSHAAGPGSTEQQNFSLFQSSPQIDALSNDVSLQRDSEQATTQQNHLPVQQRSQWVATQQNSLPVQQSCQQAATQQNHLPIQQTRQQAVTQQNSLSAPQSGQQGATRQNSLPAQQSGQQAVTRQNSLPVQQSFQQMVTRRNSLPALHIVHEKTAKPSTQRLSRKGLKQPDASKLLLLAVSPALGEVNTSLPLGCDSPAQHASPKQYFTALHASVCTAISDSVSTSSPELLREWLEKAEPEPKAAVSAKAKSGPKTPEAPKTPEGKRVWLAFKDAAGLLNRLQSRLETFLFARECPFPHVVRAGAIFIPIHVVKEQLFGNLPGASVDHVLQAHKVELRPTTLSEEKLLRERELKTCTSRMLKLLALKQLPDIYPDLLDLHWHHCVKQRLGEPTEEIWNGDLEAAEASRCLQSTAHVLGPGVRGKHKQGQKCESTPQGEAPTPPSETHPPIDPPKPQGSSSSARKRNAASTPTEGLPEEVVVGTKRFPLRSGAKRQLFRPCPLSGAFQLKLADRVTRSTSKVLRLRKSVVRIKFQNVPQERQGLPALGGKKQKQPPLLLPRSFRRQGTGARHAPWRHGYPELVGKRIRHLYEDKDKTEAWYRGVVLRVHKPHKDPLKTVYEVKYDSEPEWQYYLEILQDYKKGWLEVDE